MSRALATLSIDLIARLASLEADFGKAVRLSENANDRMARQAKATQDAVLGIGKALGAAFAGTQFVAGVQNVINQLDALNDIADATGTTIENASALEDVARRTGTEVGAMTSALVKLNSELSAATPWSDTERILKSIGLSAEELRRIDPAEALLKVSQALAGYADDGEKARVVQALFGKSVKEVAPLLKDLAEQGQLNATVTAEQAKQAENFNKQLSSLGKNLTDVVRGIAGDLLPDVNKYLAALSKLQTGPGLLAAAGEALKGNVFREPAQGVAYYAGELEKLGKQISAVRAEEKGGYGQQQLAQLEQSQKKMQGLKTYYQQLQGMNAPEASYSNEGRVRTAVIAPGTAGAKAAKTGVVSRVASPGVDAIHAYIDKLKAAEESTRNLTEMEKLREAMTAANFATITPAQRTQLELLARKIDLTKDPLLKAYQDEEARRISVLNSLLSATPTEQLEKARAEMQLLAEAFAAGTINAEQFNEAATVRLGLDKVPEQADGKKATDSFLDQAERNIESRLSGSISSVFKGEFSSISKSFGDLMIDLAAQAAAAELANSLFGNKGADGTRSGGGLSDALSWAKLLFSANGNAFDAGGRISYFANGGVFGSPTAFQYGGGSLGVMGEAGPEAVMPLKRGKGGKLGVVAQGTGRAVVIQQTMNFGDGVNRSELQQYGEAIKQQTLAAVYRGRTRGGAYE